MRQNTVNVWNETQDRWRYKRDDKKVYTPGLSFTSRPYDTARANQLLVLAQGSDKLTMAVTAAVMEAKESIISNGNMAAILATWGKVNDNVIRAPVYDMKEAQKLAVASYLFIPVKRDVERKFSLAEALYEQDSYYTLNMRAGPGLTAPTLSKITPMLADSSKARASALYVDLTAEYRTRSHTHQGSAYRALSEDPTLGTFMLKTKEEVREASKRLSKVRSYHVGPVVYRLLVGPLLSYWKKFVADRFVDNPASALLFGFSWVGRRPGGKMLVERLQTLNPGASFYTGFGDDQYAAFRMLNGKFGLLAFDITAMDQCCNKLTNTAATQRIKWDVAANLAPGNEGALLVADFWRDTMNEARVVGPKGACWTRRGGIMTGGNGVTEVETLTIAGILAVASSEYHNEHIPTMVEPEFEKFRLGGAFRSLCDDVADEKDAHERKVLYENVLARYGFIVKESTRELDFHDDFDGQFVTKLPLLGQRLTRFPWGPSALPEYHRLLVRFLFNVDVYQLESKVVPRTLAVMGLHLIRCVAYTIQGLGLDTDYYSLMKMHYEQLRGTLLGLLQRLTRPDGSVGMTVHEYWSTIESKMPALQLDAIGYEPDRALAYALMVFGSGEILPFPLQETIVRLFSGDEKLSVPNPVPALTKKAKKLLAAEEKKRSWAEMDEEEETEEEWALPVFAQSSVIREPEVVVKAAAVPHSVKAVLASLDRPLDQKLSQPGVPPPNLEKRANREAREKERVLRAKERAQREASRSFIEVGGRRDKRTDFYYDSMAEHYVAMQEIQDLLEETDDLLRDQDEDDLEAEALAEMAIARMDLGEGDVPWTLEQTKNQIRKRG